MKKKISAKNLNPQAPVEKLLEAQQLELGNMNLLSLLQFGSQILLKDAIAQEITQYLGRDFYKLNGYLYDELDGSTDCQSKTNKTCNKKLEYSTTCGDRAPT
ncbi:MAG: hypothetical protein H6625_08910 [Bdellovibrionaceae bacterium]|nr:hypothetical protein [Pseudobdellovibrionaceae bacterium]